jgi:hypothetical protein
MKIFMYKRFGNHREAKSKTSPQESDLTCELVAGL